MIPEVIYGHFLKVPVVKRKHFTIMLEETTEGTFIHCDVTKYNASVRKELLDTFCDLGWLHGGPIYALHDFTDRKHEKFLKMFGFKYLKDMPNLQQIWIWRKSHG